MIGKILLGLVVIDRPRTTEKCIQGILKNTPRDKFTFVIVDNGSNDETKTMLRKYEKDADIVVWNEWNTGCVFGINRWMSYREKGQTCIDVNADVHLYSDDWLEIFDSVISEPDIGVVAGRRPEFWIDSLWKFDLFAKDNFVYPEERNGIWCEFMKNSLIVGPFWMIKGKLIDKIGFMNEAVCYDDIDYCKRVHQTGLKSCYVPLVHIRQPQDEEQHHPQYGSHMALLGKNSGLFNYYKQQYENKYNLYCGTRFLPDTMKDDEYTKKSDDNWEFLKNWRDV